MDTQAAGITEAGPTVTQVLDLRAQERHGYKRVDSGIPEVCQILGTWLDLQSFWAAVRGDGSCRKDYWGGKKEKITGENQQQWRKTHAYLEKEVVVFCEEGGEFQRQKRCLKGPTMAVEGTVGQELTKDELPVHRCATAQLLFLSGGGFST